MGERFVGVAFQMSPLAGRTLLDYFRSQVLRDTKECALEIVRYCSELPHAPFGGSDGCGAAEISRKGAKTRRRSGSSSVIPAPVFEAKERMVFMRR